MTTDWSQVAAMGAVVALFVGVVVKWIKVENKLRQVCHYLGLDENGNPPKDSTGKVRRSIDSDVVREVVRSELQPTIKMPRKDGETA